MHYAIYYIHCHHFHGTDAEKELEWPTFAFTFSCIAFSHISYPFVMMVLPLLPLVVLVPHFYNTICTNACYCTLVLHPTYDIRHTHTLYVCVVLHILLRHIICTWYIYIWCVYEAGGIWIARGSHAMADCWSGSGVQRFCQHNMQKRIPGAHTHTTPCTSKSGIYFCAQ